MAFGAGLLLSCFGLFIGLLIGSVIVRSAVALVNRMIGPVKTDDFGQWGDWDSDEEPAYVRNRRRGGEQAVPEPGFATGMLVTFVAGIAHLFIGVVVGILAADVLEDLFDDELVVFAVFVLSTPLVFAFVTLTVRTLLPTTFWRAAGVAMLCYFIAAAAAGVAVGAIYGAWLLTGP